MFKNIYLKSKFIVHFFIFYFWEAKEILLYNPLDQHKKYLKTKEKKIRYK